MHAYIARQLLPHLRSFFLAPVFENSEKTRRARLLNLILLTTLAMWVCLAVTTLIFYPDRRQISTTISLIILWEIATLLLLQTGRIRMACNLLVCGLGGLTVFATLFLGEVRQIGYSAYVLVILTGGLLLGRQTIIYLTSTGITVGLLVIILQSQGLLPDNTAAAPEAAWAAISLSFVWVSLALYVVLQTTEETVQAARTELAGRIGVEQKIQHYTERLEVLREIDQSILASQMPEDIAHAALRHVRKLIPCKRASVTLFDYEADQAILLATNVDGRSNLEKGRRLPLKSFSSLPYLKQGKFHLEEDIQARQHASESREHLLSEGVRAILNIPLNSRGQLIGALNIGAANSLAFKQDDIQVAYEIANSLAVALQNARFFQDSQEQAIELAGLYETALATTSVLEKNTLMARLYSHVERLLSPDTFVVVLYNQENRGAEVAFVMEEKERLREFEGVHLALEESGLTGWVLSNKSPLLVGDLESDPLPVQPKHSGKPARSWLGVPLIAREKLIGAISVQSFRKQAFSKKHLRFLESLAAQVAITLENARLFETERKRTHELAVVAKVSAALRGVQTLAGILPVIQDQVFELLDAQGTAIAIYNPDGELNIECARGAWIQWKNSSGKSGRVDLESVLCKFQAYTNIDLRVNSDGKAPGQPNNFPGSVNAAVYLPLLTQKKTTGYMFVGRETSFSDEEINLLSTIADIAASAIHRSKLHELTVRRLQQVQALHAIDQAITSSVDLGLTLKTVLEQVKNQLRVDAATILLLNERTKVLECASRIGFQTGALGHTHLPIGQSYAGQAALKRQIVQVADLAATPGDFSRARLLGSEGFIAYYAVPLIAKGQVKGVLELFHRGSREPDPDWKEFLTSLATQAAIAIDNAEMFQNLQRSNQELALAYDTTLEGWSRALELRDQETEGHAHRVTELTLRLARALGMTDAELMHVRRGALLHDIGKMGIPDSILLKKGPLSEDEWDIMRQHPVYAQQLLAPVPFLKPALDIPYAHHEKWDGSGYPQGLKGTQIPLSARIFAIVDVWDALNSDRPYRKAWPRERALEYIRSQSGKHFDPKVVEVFLKLIEGELAPSGVPGRQFWKN